MCFDLGWVGLGWVDWLVGWLEDLKALSDFSRLVHQPRRISVLLDWLIDWWLIDWWLIDWLIDWLIEEAESFVPLSRLVHQQRLISVLIDWLIDDWLIDDWLIARRIWKLCPTFLGRSISRRLFLYRLLAYLTRYVWQAKRTDEPCVACCVCWG